MPLSSAKHWSLLCACLQVASLRQRAYVLHLYALTLLRCDMPAMLEPVLSALLLDPSVALSDQTSQQNGLAPGPAGFTGQGPINPYSTPAALLALQQICSVTLEVRLLDDADEMMFGDCCFGLYVG